MLLGAPPRRQRVQFLLHDESNHADGPNIRRRTDHFAFDHFRSFHHVEERKKDEHHQRNQEDSGMGPSSPMYSRLPVLKSFCLRLSGLKL